MGGVGGGMEGGRNTFTLTDTATGRESRIPDSKKLWLCNIMRHNLCSECAGGPTVTVMQTHTANVTRVQVCESVHAIQMGKLSCR